MPCDRAHDAISNRPAGVSLVSVCVPVQKKQGESRTQPPLLSRVNADDVAQRSQRCLTLL